MTVVSAGSIGFARTTGIMGRLIRLGEWLKFRQSEFNHMFIVSDGVDEKGEPLIIQATIRGVTGSAPLNTVAPGGQFVILTLPAGVDPQKVLEFAKSQIGTEYGVLTILAIALDILSFSWVPAFMGSRKPSWICSGLSCEALRFGGWLHEWVNLYTVMPPQAYDVLTGAK
jgi:hypothetical protein